MTMEMDGKQCRLRVEILLLYKEKLTLTIYICIESVTRHNIGKSARKRDTHYIIRVISAV